MTKNPSPLFLLCALLCGTTAGAAETAPIQTAAQDPAASGSVTEEVPIEMPVIEVIGTPERKKNLPGSAQVIDRETLELSHVMTTSEALRKAAGVNVRDEEGFGLRPNIGVRGLNPTRSTKVLLLEDGIPLAYAPYGDNASYYHPPVDRFDRIELLKGAAQNLYGPQTVGGVLNYITPAPPADFAGGFRLTGGNREYLNGHGYVGGNNLLFDFVRKEGDGARDNIHSDLNDVNFKAVTALGARQALTFRANYYSEDSQITYSGLTDAEYANFGARYNPFDNDEFKADREGASVTHELGLGEGGALTTNVYVARFNRDWWRQASTTTDSQCGTGFRDARIAGSEVDPDSCASIQGRLREYYTYGVEPRLRLAHGVLGGGEFETGVRVHYETQDRIQRNGTSPDLHEGTVVEDNERTAQAYAAFAQNRFQLGRFAVIPGLRVERVEYERTNNGNGSTLDADLTEVIPSLGATFSASETLTLFAGIHRGFAPPRTEDILGQTSGSLSGTVTSVDVEAEESWNSELGLRARPALGLAFDATVFRNDFSRQIAVGSIAGGSVPLATGETLYQGVELQGRADLGRMIDSMHNPFVELAYTWLPTADQETALERVDTGAAVTGSAAGKRLPYAPEHLLTASLGYSHPVGFDTRVEAVMIDDQYSDFANRADPDGSGLVGKIDRSVVWNAAVNYTLFIGGPRLFVTAKNLFDRTYIADRTRGIMPGAPRLVQAGVEYQFN